MTADPDPEPGPPLLRVRRGSPSVEELAALVAVLAAATRPGDGVAPAPSRWASRDHTVHAVAPLGPGAWRASAWPR